YARHTDRPRGARAMHRHRAAKTKRCQQQAAQRVPPASRHRSKQPTHSALAAMKAACQNPEPAGLVWLPTLGCLDVPSLVSKSKRSSRRVTRPKPTPLSHVAPRRPLASSMIEEEDGRAMPFAATHDRALSAPTSYASGAQPSVIEDEARARADTGPL